MAENQEFKLTSLHTRRSALKLLGLGTAAIVLTACDNGGGQGVAPGTTSTQGSGPAATPVGNNAVDFSARFAQYQVSDEPNVDPASVTLPDFVTSGGPDLVELYNFQLANGDLMKWMPCFCGCGKSDGHTSNRDCYVDKVNADGTVVFDNMAPT